MKKTTKITNITEITKNSKMLEVFDGWMGKCLAFS